MENQNTLNSKHSRPALFLDRDGVINIDHGYVSRAEQITFIDGIFDLIKAANSKGHYVIVITNQSGIARGYYSLNDFNDLTSWMIDEFKKESAVIDRVYHCPHHPHEGLGSLKLDCRCRKPLPGMIFEAAKDFKIDLEKSIIVGDNVTDILAGARGGIGNLFLLCNNFSHCYTSAPQNTIFIQSLRDFRLMNKLSQVRDL